MNFCSYFIEGDSHSVTQFLMKDETEDEFNINDTGPKKIENISELKMQINNVIRGCLIQYIFSYEQRDQVLQDLIPQVNNLIDIYDKKNEQYEIQINDQLIQNQQLNIRTKTNEQENFEKIEKVEQEIFQCYNIPSLKQKTQNKRTAHKRGPYKRYTQKTKEEALKRIYEGYSLRGVCSELGIPKKNLKRWIDMGSERKKGGGRKRMDESMEQELYNWCLQEGLNLGRPVTRKMIRQRALELSKFPNKFKASKGWTDKFVKKFNLRKRVIRELQEMGLYQKGQKRSNSQIETQQMISQEIYGKIAKTETDNASLVDNQNSRLQNLDYDMNDRIFLEE